jgi:calcineurin-like phosphoesterase
VSKGPTILNAVVIDIDAAGSRAKSIERLYRERP